MLVGGRNLLLVDRWRHSVQGRRGVREEGIVGLAVRRRRTEQRVEVLIRWLRREIRRASGAVVLLLLLHRIEAEVRRRSAVAAVAAAVVAAPRLANEERLAGRTRRRAEIQRTKVELLVVVAIAGGIEVRRSGGASGRGRLRSVGARVVLAHEVLLRIGRRARRRGDRSARAVVLYLERTRSWTLEVRLRLVGRSSRACVCHGARSLEIRLRLIAGTRTLLLLVVRLRGIARGTRGWDGAACIGHGARSLEIRLRRLLLLLLLLLRLLRLLRLVGHCRVGTIETATLRYVGETRRACIRWWLCRITRVSSW